MKLYETINAENWGKGIGDKHCLLAHLMLRYRIAPGDDSWTRSPEYRSVREAAAALYPERMASWWWVPNFNDHPDTTVEDVIRVCKVADV